MILLKKCNELSYVGYLNNLIRGEAGGTRIELLAVFEGSLVGHLALVSLLGRLGVCVVAGLEDLNEHA